MRKETEDRDRALWRQSKRVRKMQAQRESWFKNWADKTGPLLGVPAPEGKQEGGRV